MTVKTEYAHSVFSWVDLMAHDLDVATEFYGNLFGWRAFQPETDGGPPYTMFQLAEQNVAGGGQISDEMKAGGMPSMWNSYINVDDIEAVVARAKELGATITMPVVKVTDAGWLAYFQDPTGGNVGLWQKGEHCGSGLADEPGTFCWNELATRDIDTAAKFYGELLGWTFEEVPGTPTKYLLIKVDGENNGGMLQMNEQWEGIPPVWTVYFAVADTDAAAAKVTELGGKINVPPFATPFGKISVVADPQGAIFSVIASAQASA